MNKKEQELYKIYIPPKERKIVADKYLKDYKKLECMYEPRSKEEVCCRLCETSINVYRHQPRTGKANPLYMSTRFSTYKPQALQQCKCGELQVLVDHHGRVRVYTLDEAQVQIRFPLLGLAQGYASQNLGLAKHIDNWPVVDKNLQASEKSKKYDERFESVNHLNLWPIRESKQAWFLPYPIDRHQFYIDYAYTYKIVLLVTIKGKRTMYFPNGFHKQVTNLELITCDNQRANEIVLELMEEHVHKTARKIHGNFQALQLRYYPKVCMPFLQWERRMPFTYENNYVRVNQYVYGRLKRLQEYRQELLLHHSREAKWFIYQDKCTRFLKTPKHPELLYYLDKYPHMQDYYLHLHPTTRKKHEDCIPWPY